MTPQEVKDWRSAHKLSQGALAARLGVHEISVSRWERGSSPIPPFLRLALWAIDHGAPTA